MNRRKSSQPEDTETVDVFTFVRASVARLISSRRPAIVPAGKLQLQKHEGKCNVLQGHFTPSLLRGKMDSSGVI